MYTRFVLVYSKATPYEPDETGAEYPAGLIAKLPDVVNKKNNNELPL